MVSDARKADDVLWENWRLIYVGWGIGILVWLWVDKLGGYPLWLALPLANLASIIYEISLCKYELHVSDTRKIAKVALGISILLTVTIIILSIPSR